MAGATFVPEVGEGATLHGWSDAHAHTIVSVSASGKSFEMQRDKATLLNGVTSGEPDALKFQAGGFCGHTSGRQRYSYEPDTEAPRIRVRMTKRGWTHIGQRVSEGRHEHYDFNF